MLKTYVSIVDLLSDIIKYTDDCQNTGIPINFIDEGPIFEVTTELVPSLDKTETAVNERPPIQNTKKSPHPLDMLRESMQEKSETEDVNNASNTQEQNNNTTSVVRYIDPTKRFLRTIRGPRSLVQIKTDDQGEVALPYILEIEYLKHSDFGFTAAELAVMDQLFALYIREWVCITKVIELVYETGQTEIELFTDIVTGNRSVAMVDLMEVLKENGKLINMDLNPDTMGQMHQIIRKAYQNFKIFEETTSAFKKNMPSVDYGFAKSSIDAFKIINTRTKSRLDKVGTSILYMPIIAVFHLLECTTSIVKAFTLDDYQKYKALIDAELFGTHRIRNTEENVVDQSFDISNSFRFYDMGFSFGYYNQGRSIEGDQRLVSKIIQQICNRLEKIASENLSIISVDDIRQIRKGQYQILLNANTLTWMAKSESDNAVFF